MSTCLLYKDKRIEMSPARTKTLDSKHNQSAKYNYFYYCDVETIHNKFPEPWDKGDAKRLTPPECEGDPNKCTQVVYLEKYHGRPEE